MVGELPLSVSPTVADLSRRQLAGTAAGLAARPAASEVGGADDPLGRVSVPPIVPMPSWPWEFLPQHQAFPKRSSASPEVAIPSPLAQSMLPRGWLRSTLSPVDWMNDRELRSWV
jgi:hypothetical protein